MGKTLKFGIVLLVLLCLVLVVITVLDLSVIEAAVGPALPTSEPGVESTGENDLVSAVHVALEKGSDRWEEMAYQIDRVEVQEDGQMALVWLAAVDPETGLIVEREPELALGELGEDGSWQVLLEDNDRFEGKFVQFQYMEKSIQGDLMAEDDSTPKATKVYGGYYLPWAANLEKRLTWSISHTSCYADYCYYAFDFADGTMFPLVAAKGGTVYHWKDTCANGDSTCTNSITLEDRSTTPWTYQIYLHIAKDSIPDHLKNVGAPVLQGQYIADVDDTGYSTGHHVHFMVVTKDTVYTSRSGYVFGKSVDITFKDVSINWDAGTQGGRPRLKYEADRYGGEGKTYYTSGNQPAHPPTGGLNEPQTKTLVTNPVLAVSGWGEDDVAVTKMEVLANYGGGWVQIAEERKVNPFNTTINLCETTIPKGPFNLALRVWDYEGNPSAILSVRKLINNVECGTPGTEPAVELSRKGGVLALPKNGFVGASVMKGSTGAEIAAVEFWLHDMKWNKGDWVYLGKDTHGADGWQAPMDTSDLAEGNTYTLVAVATDIAGRQGADVTFSAIVDHTPPTGRFSRVASPVSAGWLTIDWTAADDRTGLDYATLEVSNNTGAYQILEAALPPGTTTYRYALSPAQTAIFRLKIYDKSGNCLIQKLPLYTEGFVFPYHFIFPTFSNQPGE